MDAAQDTAYLIAHIRASEASLPQSERLFDDPYARCFVPPVEAEDGVQRFLLFEFLREYVRVRTRFIDDFVAAGLEAGVEQVVILGVGFDCRSLRIPGFLQGKARVFEVDVAGQLARRRAHLETAGVAQPAYVRPVEFDFTEADLATSLTTALVREGFQPDADVRFVWEGVVPYIDDAAVAHSLAFMARASSARRSVVFDYHAMRFPDGAASQSAHTAGFPQVEDIGLEVLYPRYCHATPPDVAASFRMLVAHAGT